MLKLFEELKNGYINEWRYITQCINHKEHIFESALFDGCIEIKTDPLNDKNGKRINAKHLIFLRIVVFMLVVQLRDHYIAGFVSILAWIIKVLVSIWLPLKEMY